MNESVFGMILGGIYNFKHKSERLIYMGYNFSGNGHWHQFELEGKSGVIWCEIDDHDLQSLIEINYDYA